MEIREALIMQAPSLALQRAAGDEIARLDAKVKQLTTAHYEALAAMADMHARLKHARGVVTAALEYQNGVSDRAAPPGTAEFNDLGDFVDRIHLALEGLGLTCETTA